MSVKFQSLWQENGLWREYCISTSCQREFVIIFLPPANEVWGKVIFLHQFAILFTGGVPGRYTPPLAGTSPWAGTPPLDRYTHQAGTPPGRYTPLGRYTPPWAGTPPWPGTPPGQVHPPDRYTPLDRYIPPGQVHPPSRQVAGTPPWVGTPPWAGTPSPRCGQRAGGTHPTGMQSFLWLIFTGPGWGGGMAPSPLWIRYCNWNGWKRMYCKRLATIN